MSHDWHADINDWERDAFLDSHNPETSAPEWSENPDYPHEKPMSIDVTFLRDANWVPKYITITSQNGDLEPSQAFLVADSLEQVLARNAADLSDEVITGTKRVADWLRYWAKKDITVNR